MKIEVDGIELLTLTETQKKVIQNEIPADKFEDDMKRRLNWVLTHKYEQCFKRLKAEWEPKLAASGVKMIPTDPDAFAELVFAHKDYKSRSQRNAESTPIGE